VTPEHLPSLAPIVRIVVAELDRPAHQRDVVAMTVAYAQDAMGNAGPLPAEVLQRLIPALRAHRTTLILLAYLDQEAVGIATCFVGFSTFAARPLINIHDLAVLPPYRGRGIGRALLDAVEQQARQRGCVKLTLEVHADNQRARAVYKDLGFSDTATGAAAGGTLFYTKPL
jgi:ribosomal protein S18 acetylase RimI-like enzyme